MARKSRKNGSVLQENALSLTKKVYQTAIYVRISVENERKLEADSIGNQIQMLDRKSVV